MKTHAVDLTRDKIIENFRAAVTTIFQIEQSQHL